MNFFEQQDRAQRNTKRLILLLCLAVISLIAITTLLFASVFYYSNFQQRPEFQTLTFWQGMQQSISLNLFAGICLGIISVVFLGSLYKLFQFSGGGRDVAKAMGGQLIDQSTTNTDERKILNVVEEMAIASGTCVPPVYIMEDSAINAFAAGHTPQDAVIGITRGCIQLLNRDELQGVIAHEFSHIYHGDMRLNLRIVSLLNGILLLGLIGEFLLRSQHNRLGVRSSRDKSPFAIMAIGIGLLIIGYTGTFFGNLIKSAVSRQREFLADASAVKFTRNPEGIAGALKKIGGYSSGSQLSNEHSAEFSHMYFSAGIRASFLNMMATHPPLEERIKRIDPHWNGAYPSVNFSEEDNNSYIKEERPSSQQNLANPIEFFAGIDQVIESIGSPTSAHLNHAKQILNDIDDATKKASHTLVGAQGLMLGLLLDKTPTQQEHQWQLLEKIFIPEEFQQIKPHATHAFKLAPQLRLALVEISLPTLKQLTPIQYQHFKYALNTLIRADQHVNLVEWSFYRILTHNLEPKAPSTRAIDLSQLKTECITLLSALAYAGTNASAAAKKAFDNSKSITGLDSAEILTINSYTMMDLDLAVTRLNNLKPLQKPKLLKALGQCVLDDGKTTVEEAELFRAIADTLDCPTPPFLTHSV